MDDGYASHRAILNALRKEKVQFKTLPVFLQQYVNHYARQQGVTTSARALAKRVAAHLADWQAHTAEEG